MKYELTNQFLYYKDENEIVAYLHFEIIDETLNIDKTYVNPKYRGQGIAKLMMDYIFLHYHSVARKISATCSYAKSYLDNK